MIHFGWAIGTLFFGGILGLFVGCLCSVSGMESKKEELMANFQESEEVRINE